MPEKQQAAATPAPPKDEPNKPPAQEPTQQTGEPDTAQDKAAPVEKDEPNRTRTIALPMTGDGDERRPDLFGLDVEAEPAGTDYGNVAKFKVKGPRSVVDELAERAHEALTFKRKGRTHG